MNGAASTPGKIIHHRKTPASSLGPITYNHLANLHISNQNVQAHNGGNPLTLKRTMDISNYKKLTTSRGFTYSYYRRAPSPEIVAQHSPEDPALPALLFLHGFPTSSRLWRHQVEYFHDQGFFICAPDLLGFGGTSRPTDPEVYRASLICKDIMEILDEEDMQKVIVVGHDLLSISTTIYDFRY